MTEMLLMLVTCLYAAAFASHSKTNGDPMYRMYNGASYIVLGVYALMLLVYLPELPKSAMWGFVGGIPAFVAIRWLAGRVNARCFKILAWVTAVELLITSLCASVLAPNYNAVILGIEYSTEYAFIGMALGIFILLLMARAYSAWKLGEAQSNSWGGRPR